MGKIHLPLLIAVGAMLPILSGESQAATKDQTAVSQRVQRWTKLLLLTAEQQSQARTIFLAAERAVSGLDSEIRGARASLSAALRENDVIESEVQSARVAHLQAQRSRVFAAANDTFYLLLTPRQQSTYLNLASTEVAAPAFPYPSPNSGL